MYWYSLTQESERIIRHYLAEDSNGTCVEDDAASPPGRVTPYGLM